MKKSLKEFFYHTIPRVIFLDLQENFNEYVCGLNFKLEFYSTRNFNLKTALLFF